MRDILITLCMLALLPLAIRRPWVGIVIWAWLAMMIPYRLAYGFARTLPFAELTAICTLLGILFSGAKIKPQLNSVNITYLSFIAWMMITSLFALNSQELVLAQAITVVKIHLMIFLTMALIDDYRKLNILIWTLVGSIGFYGIKGGIFTITTGGSGRVWGPPGGVIQGNNELGVALAIILPFLYFLHQTARNRLAKYGLLAAGVLIVLAILGTQSRGALLTLLAIAMFLVLKGKRPIVTTLGVTAVLGIAIVSMPDSWVGRMDTIQQYQADGSAMSRLYTWQTLINVAIDRPLVGAGFRTDNPFLFAKYAPPGGVGDYTAGGVYVAHSIYFQALGEHGFPGLILYLMLGVASWRTAGRTGQLAAKIDTLSSWLPLLMRMTQVSLIGFAVGGAFLSLLHFDLPYYICAITVIGSGIVVKCLPTKERLARSSA